MGGGRRDANGEQRDDDSGRVEGGRRRAGRHPKAVCRRWRRAAGREGGTGGGRGGRRRRGPPHPRLPKRVESDSRGERGDGHAGRAAAQAPARRLQHDEPLSCRRRRVAHSQARGPPGVGLPGGGFRGWPAPLPAAVRRRRAGGGAAANVAARARGAAQFGWDGDAAGGRGRGVHARGRGGGGLLDQASAGEGGRAGRHRPTEWWAVASPDQSNTSVCGWRRPQWGLD